MKVELSGIIKDADGLWKRGDKLRGKLDIDDPDDVRRAVAVWHEDVQELLCVLSCIVAATTPGGTMASGIDQYVNFVTHNARYRQRRIDELEAALVKIIEAVDAEDVRAEIKHIAEKALWPEDDDE